MWALIVAVICFGTTFSHANDNAISTERDPANKIVLVTGGAKGIGYAIAENFLRNNAKVVIIVDIDKIRGKEAQSTLNKKYGAGKVDYQYGDVVTDLERIFGYVSRKYRYVDVFVSNAGVTNEYEIKHTLDVNTYAMIEWSLKFFDIMRKDHNGKGGTIIILASVAGYMRFPLIITYGASKAAMLSFSYNLGHEYTYRTTGVRVVALCPGSTYTDLATNTMVVAHEHEALWEKFVAADGWQIADHVGKCAVDIYKNASSGTAWTIARGEDPYEAPQSTYVSVSTLDAL